MGGRCPARPAAPTGEAATASASAGTMAPGTRAAAAADELSQLPSSLSPPAPHVLPPPQPTSAIVSTVGLHVAKPLRQPQRWEENCGGCRSCPRSVLGGGGGNVGRLLRLPLCKDLYTVDCSQIISLF